MDFLTPSLPFIAALQKLGWLAGPARFLSLLGNEEFFLLLLPFIYWCVNRKLGARMGVLLLVSVLINHTLKVAFAAPRPYWLDPSLKMAEETSFGFPSGHAQNAALLWPFLALNSRNRKLWVPLAVLLAMAIAFSRLYLGVHFPADAFGGALVGLSILGFARWLEPRFLPLWKQASVPVVAIGAIAFCVLAIGTSVLLGQMHSASIHTSDLTTQANDPKTVYAFAGAFFGLLVGLAAARPLNYQIPAALGRRLVCLLIGLVGLALCYFGLKAVLPEAAPLRFLRYALTTLWVSYGAVWVFGRVERGGKIKRVTLS